jgi:transcriptional regulator with XRE-family HTH domain
MPVHDEIKNIFSDHISRRLSEQQKETGLTYQEIADRVGVTVGTVHKYLTGDSEYPIAGLFQIATGLRMTLPQVLDDLTLPRILQQLQSGTPLPEGKTKAAAEAALAGLSPTEKKVCKHLRGGH